MNALPCIVGSEIILAMSRLTTRVRWLVEAGSAGVMLYPFLHKLGSRQSIGFCNALVQCCLSALLQCL